MGRVWESPRGNLYASGLVDLQPDDPDAATLALLAAVALYDAIAIWAPAIQLKWPNDVLLGNGAKLSGILLERKGDAVVVGFGVNLAHHPHELDRLVSSIAALGVVPPTPAKFLDALADTFARWLTRWRTDGMGVISAAWLTRAHPVGTALTVNLPDCERLEGLFDGLSDECALRLRLADGAVRVIHAGDVFLI